MSKPFTVMSYNVHSGIGMDGRLSPLRIAEVIELCDPDIVALQELDAGVGRSGMIHQAQLIAMTLNMTYHFHGSIQIEEGEYGNAVLSRYPLRLVKAGPLPAEPISSSFERRGAIWVEIELTEKKLQLVATHLGLNRQERMLQTQALVSEQWLGQQECRPPLVLCGDFNAIPGSPVYRYLCRHLKDAQLQLRGRRPRCTWPVTIPFMRIDHLFTTSDLRVLDISVPWTSLTRAASDHLPLVVTLEAV